MRAKHTRVAKLRARGAQRRSRRGAKLFRGTASLLLSITSASRARDPDRPRPVSRGVTGGGQEPGASSVRPPAGARLATRSRPDQVTCCQSVSVTSDLSVDPAPVLTFSRRETCRWADGRARADQGGRSCTRLLPASTSHAGHCLGLPGERHNPISNTHTQPERREHKQAGPHIRDQWSGAAHPLG